MCAPVISWALLFPNGDMVYSASFFCSMVVILSGRPIIGGLCCFVLVRFFCSMVVILTARPMVGGFLCCLVLIGVGGLIVVIWCCCRVLVGIGWRACSIFMVSMMMVVLMVGRYCMGDIGWWWWWLVGILGVVEGCGQGWLVVVSLAHRQQHHQRGQHLVGQKACLLYEEMLSHLSKTHFNHRSLHFGTEQQWLRSRALYTRSPLLTVW